MAKLRKGVCYRRLERPYTRKSRIREKSYVKGVPHPKVVAYDMGNPNGNFQYEIVLKSLNNVQIRHNALEAARVAVNKRLSKKIGNQNYHFKLKPYPHHVLRENPLAAGAGADRFQTGMSHAFGKPKGLAARVFRNQELMIVRTNKEFVEAAKEALRLAKYKFPLKTRIEIREVKQ